MRKVLLRFVLFIFSAAAIAPANVRAQTAESGTTSTFEQRKLLVPHKNPDGSIKVIPFLTDPVLWVRGELQNFYGAMSGALRAMRDGNAYASGAHVEVSQFWLWHISCSRTWRRQGVISAWLLATENQLRRGILVGFMSAIVQPD